MFILKKQKMPLIRRLILAEAHGILGIAHTMTRYMQNFRFPTHCLNKIAFSGHFAFENEFLFTLCQGLLYRLLLFSKVKRRQLTVLLLTLLILFDIVCK